MKQVLQNILTSLENLFYWTIDVIKRFFSLTFLLFYALLFIAALITCLFIAWFLVFLRPVRRSPLS
jgi:hypothetical protein